MFGGVAARVRSLSISRPNWNRAPPTTSPHYGWADRVERAGGVDERQLRREEERSRRPVAIPVPNPAPGPINVRGDKGPSGLNEQSPMTTALQPPALVRRSTRASNRPSEVGARIATGHRSATSSPKIIEHKDIKRDGQAAPGSSKPGQAGTNGHRRHLSRVEKIAAVIQHVASLPWMSDSPVQTYYPPKEKAVVPPAKPFHVFDPAVPKRYQPPPPMPPCWYQPKPPKAKKSKEPKKPKKAESTKNPVAEDVGDRGFRLGGSEEEFEYPDYDDYMNYGYTGDTPTLQSDQPTEESETVYEPRMIQDISFAEYSMRPAYFPGPIKSTGLTTAPRYLAIQPVGPRPLQIMPPPEHEGSASTSGSSSSYGPIPSPLTTTHDYSLSRVNSQQARSQQARTPLFIPTDFPPPESYSAVTAIGPPLVIPSPRGAKAKGASTPNGKFGPLPGGYSPQPYSKHYEAYMPPKGQRISPNAYGPSPQELYDASPHAYAYGLSPPGVKPSAKDFGPSPQIPFGIPLKAAYGPSPQVPYGPSPQFLYGPPPGPYGPSPLAPYGPAPQGVYDPPPQDYSSYPHAFYAETPHYVWSWGAPPYAAMAGQIPPPPPIPGESPPPIPSPIATSTTRSRSSRHK
jgi:hypothetical protein